MRRVRVALGAARDRGAARRGGAHNTNTARRRAARAAAAHDLLRT